MRELETLSLEALGIGQDYVQNVRGLLPHIRTAEIAALNSSGVTPEYVRETQAIWPTVSTNEILALRTVNLDPSDIAAFQKAGLQPQELPARQLVVYKATGVSPELIRALLSVGVTQIHPNDYVTAQLHGLTPEFLKAVKNHRFHGLNMQGLLALKRAGAFG